MKRHLFCLVLLVVFGLPATAQNVLFQDQQPLELKLTSSIKDIKKKTNDSTYLPAHLYVKNASGNWDSIAIELRARGIFRRKNCYFSPIRIKVKKEAAKGTILEGNKSLKLVMPCENSSDKNELVTKELIAYKMYEKLSPYYFKTRMANLTFIESDGKKSKTHQLVAFLIEDDDLVAKRFNAKIMENLNLHPARLSDTSAVRHDLFQYMIANLDWSTTFQHNAKIMLQPTNRYIPLAYDFDMSGFVNPPYGVPNEELGQQDIRDRIYRGFCRNESVVQNVRQQYLVAQPQVMEVLGQYEKNFVPRDYATMKRYIEDFFAILKNDNDFRKRIIDGCRKK
ncbi:MAG: hypothetical protein JNL40_13525 [Cyclobacteriaceae bacterium]|nr:hypothetical protein [Cyclobacteriaceae bacterium]